LDKVNIQSITSLEPCIAFSVDLPDGDYSLVPEVEEGEAEAALQYVEVLKTPRGLRLTLLTKASPGAFNPVFQIYYTNIYGCLCI
jgi:hypothetical protein